MITQRPLERRYSLDDYFLIDREFSKRYSPNGFINEPFNHCSKYMNDSKYEEIKADLRYRIWREVRKSNETLISLHQNPSNYKKLFDMIIKFYSRVREAVLGIEEIWVFLLESVFLQELKGNLIFE